MKQFDTVKNNEFIPTAEDVDSVVLVTETLPTASQDLEGKTYLLNGSMDNSKYIESHFYKCIKDEDTGSYVWSDLNVGRYSVGGCTNIRLMMFDDGSTCRVLMCWEDPADVLMASDRVYWKETRLVHQIGHMPTDVADGTVLVTNTVRNQYQSLGAFSTTIDNSSGRKHYFKLFPISTDGGVTNDDSNGRVAGFNYNQTSDNVPYIRTGSGTEQDPYVYTYTKSYYNRVFNESTGTYSYVKCSNELGSSSYTWTDAATGDPSHATFKEGSTYYEYTNSFITWSGIRELVKNGEAETFFPLGTILTLPYHGDFGEMGYEVVDYDTVQPADGTINHTMTLESKYLYTWWDYNNGYVFDTNEKAAVSTKDNSRNYNKTYFRRQGVCWDSFLAPTNSEGTRPQIYSSATTGNYAIAIEGSTYTIATAVANYSSSDRTQGVYVESTSDATPSGTSSDVVVYYNSSATPFYKGELCECELPYNTGKHFYNSNTKKYEFYRFRPDLAISGTPAKAPSAQPLLIGNGTGGKTRSLESGIVNYSVNVRINDTLTANYGYGKYYTLDTANTTPTVAAVVCMGPISSDIGGVGPFNKVRKPQAYIPAMLPRYNGYADRFVRVERFAYVANYRYGRQRFFTYRVKYYCPIEAYYVAEMSNAAKPVYSRRQKMWLRDCTDDINSIAAKLFNSPLADMNACYTFTYDDGTNAQIDLTAVLGGVAAREATVNGTKIAAGDPIPPLLCIPSQDGVYLPGKRYFRLKYKLTTDTTFVNGKLYYRTVTEAGAMLNNSNQLLTYDGSNDKDTPVAYTVYQRVRPNTKMVDESMVFDMSATGGANPAACGYYESEYEELTAVTRAEYDAALTDTATDAAAKLEYSATHYVVGNLIPCKTSTPVYFHSRLPAVACTADEIPVDGYIYYKPLTDGGVTIEVQGSSDPIEVTVLNTFASSNPLEGCYKHRCFWTNGQIRTVAKVNEVTTDDTTTSEPDINQPVGEYVEITKDWAGRSLPGTIAGDSIAKITSNYSVNINDTSIWNKNEENYSPWRITDIYEPVISYSNTGYKQVDGKWVYGDKLENCNVFWKTPNLERVQYGNHVWAQSNLRMYFNGPFDMTNEYFPAKDKTFGGAIMDGLSNNTYYNYYKKSGAGYVRLTAKNDGDDTDSSYVIGGDIKEWENKYNTTVYQRFYGGTPVGAKLEVHRPEMYDKFGRSPIQQYKYNALSGNWEGVFEESDLWYGKGMASINDGNMYDQLAGMYCPNYVAQGNANDATPIIGQTVRALTDGGTGRTGGNYDTSVPLMPGAKYKKYNGNGSFSMTDYTYTSNKMMPRQSFLHGFLDCKYKRTADQSRNTSKTYYWRNPYGEYEAVTSNGALSRLLANPYKACLYELNEDYLSDIETAGEFLDAIIPVVNRNGAYGTREAFDFYTQQNDGMRGTMTLDKVWLMSAAQIAGGDGANNGIWENPKTNTELNDSSVKKYNSYRLALKKWRWCGNYPGDFGYTGLNASRVKYLYTVGSHGNSGYTDSLSGAAYWWLRSAGGTLSHNSDGGNANINGQVVILTRYTGYILDYNHYDGFYWDSVPNNAYFTKDSRLSPLITIG